MELGVQELKDLEYAKSLLENPGLAIKIANTIGIPIEKGFELLPQGWSKIVSSATEKAL